MRADLEDSPRIPGNHSIIRDILSDDGVRPNNGVPSYLNTRQNRRAEADKNPITDAALAARVHTRCQLGKCAHTGFMAQIALRLNDTAFANTAVSANQRERVKKRAIAVLALRQDMRRWAAHRYQLKPHRLELATGLGALLIIANADMDTPDPLQQQLLKLLVSAKHGATKHPLGAKLGVGINQAMNIPFSAL
ncbi:MAG: hypothetical protein VW877_14590 [Pseudomonadaceae bacterium]